MGVFLLLFCFCRLFYCFCTKRLLLILLKKMRKTWWKIRCRFIIIRWKVYWNAWMITWIFYWDIDCFLTQLNGENNLEKVKAQYKMLQILKERCKDTKEADAYAVVNCKDNSILIQRNGNITYDTIKDIKSIFKSVIRLIKLLHPAGLLLLWGAQVYLVKYYNYGANTIAVLISEKDWTPC